MIEQITLEDLESSKSPASISIIIPVKDEADSLSELISRIYQSPIPAPYEIIVVDDGSIDGTADSVSSPDIKVISHRINMGKGAAMKSGSCIAEGNILVFLDGDGAHDPRDIRFLTLPIIDGQADMVMGVRSLKSTRWFRSLSNCLASVVISVIVSFFVPLKTKNFRTVKYNRINDCTGGYRAITREAWNKMELKSTGFEIETEMIFEAASNGLRMTQVPLTFKANGNHSHLSVVRDGTRTATLLFSKLFS